ncbi:hypothetical protein WJX84_012225 [Apatococcus fuscideae]|uniref:Uncharacterized protein n=1 Tax=Apatococcus fuscideae TaxID=2026836 RepID=A0AAW1S7R7_9CHLO
MPGRRPYKTVLIDLDDCCYRVPELPELVRENIQKYMEVKLKIPAEQIPELCAEMYSNYGTTMAGLVAKGYEMDYDDWHADVHGTLPYAKLLPRDPALRKMLQSIPLPKYIFTNADTRHAAVCLDRMGITDCFQGVICFESVMQAAASQGQVKDGKPIICKPSKAAIHLALEQAGASAETTVYLDDSTRNVSAAHDEGIYSILIGRTGVDCRADAQLESILELPSLLPELFQQQPAASSTSHGQEGTSHVLLPAYA